MRQAIITFPNFPYDCIKVISELIDNKISFQYTPNFIECKLSEELASKLTLRYHQCNVRFTEHTQEEIDILFDSAVNLLEVDEPTDIDDVYVTIEHDFPELGIMAQDVTITSVMLDEWGDIQCYANDWFTFDKLDNLDKGNVLDAILSKLNNNN